MPLIAWCGACLESNMSCYVHVLAFAEISSVAFSCIMWHGNRSPKIQTCKTQSHGRMGPEWARSVESSFHEFPTGYLCGLPTRIQTHGMDSIGGCYWVCKMVAYPPGAPTVAVKINAPPWYNMTEWNYVRWHNNMKCVNIFQDFLYKILWQLVKNWRSYVWFICILLTR